MLSLNGMEEVLSAKNALINKLNKLHIAPPLGIIATVTREGYTNYNMEEQGYKSMRHGCS
jgi:hypothetical protein